MNEFKGTKGKWELTPMTNRIIVGKSIADVWGFDAHIDESVNKEMQANALLISKAPEMLEMLEEVKLNIAKGEVYNTDLFDKIDQLIEEATTINE